VLHWSLVPIGAVDLLVEAQNDSLPTRLTVRVLEGASEVDAAADVSAIGAEDAATTPAPADVSPEGLTFVAAHDSPSGRNALSAHQDSFRE
jgi:hypothetical protein